MDYEEFTSPTPAQLPVGVVQSLRVSQGNILQNLRLKREVRDQSLYSKGILFGTVTAFQLAGLTEIAVRPRNITSRVTVPEPVATNSVASPPVTI